jgi:hypothetical protein
VVDMLRHVKQGLGIWLSRVAHSIIALCTVFLGFRVYRFCVLKFVEDLTTRITGMKGKVK